MNTLYKGDKDNNNMKTTEGDVKNKTTSSEATLAAKLRNFTGPLE